MRDAQKVGRERGVRDPRCGRQERGERHEDRGAEQRSAEKTEKTAEDAVDNAEPDGGGGALEEPCDQRGDEHDRDDDEDEGGELCELCVRDEAGEVYGEGLVEPAGEQETKDEAGEGKGFFEKAAQDRADDRVSEDGGEEPVKRVHFVAPAGGDNFWRSSSSIVGRFWLHVIQLWAPGSAWNSEAMP